MATITCPPLSPTPRASAFIHDSPPEKPTRRRRTLTVATNPNLPEPPVPPDPPPASLATAQTPRSRLPLLLASPEISTSGSHQLIVISSSLSRLCSSAHARRLCFAAHARRLCSRSPLMLTLAASAPLHTFTASAPLLTLASSAPLLTLADSYAVNNKRFSRSTTFTDFICCHCVATAMSLRLLHGSKSMSTLLAMTHLPAVTSLHHFRLAATASPNPPTPPVPPDPPPVPPDPPDPPDPRDTQELHNQPLGYQSSQPPASSYCNGNRRGSSPAPLCTHVAVTAASHLEIHHLSVFSDSRSLVSLITSNGDVNELESVRLDTRCLIETFSFISFSFISHSINVKVDAFAKAVLNSYL